MRRASTLIYLPVGLLSLIFCLVVNGQRATDDGLVVALSSRISSLDFLTNTSSDSTADSLRPLIFNSLTRRASHDLSIEGDLAKTITTSRDGRSITFILRSGVKFHDGRPLTAEDVKYTLETLLDANSFKARAFFETVRTNDRREEVRLISGITVDGPESVTLNIVRANVRDWVLLHLASIPIVPAGSAAQGRDMYIGTGPFQVVRLSPNEGEVLLSANPLYWDGKPPVSSLRFKTIVDFKQLYAELESEGVDLFRIENWITPSERRQLERLNRIQVRAFDGRNVQYLALNVTSPPLNDLNIRKAIAHAIDRRQLIREYFAGNAQPADSILPPNSWAYTRGTDHGFNITMAQKLVEASKHKDQTLVIQAPSGNAHVLPVITAMRGSFKRAGLKVEIEFLEVSSLRANLMLGKFQMYVGTWIGGNQDPVFLRDLFHSSRIPGGDILCCNRSRYDNPRVDALLDFAGAQMSKEIAAGKYREAWERISTELPVIPLWYPSDVIAHDRRIQINSKPNDGFDFLKSVTFKK